MRPKLTIGMATYEDFDGVIFSIQSLRMANDCSNVEFIVVDNAPMSAHGQQLQITLPGLSRSGEGCKREKCPNMGLRIVTMSENGGTTQPRNRVFTEANGEIVLCMDSHVLFFPGMIEKLIAWYDAHPDFNGLVQGPLTYDDLNGTSSTFNNVWSSQMWGQWGSDPRENDEQGEAFEIFAQGLGVFSCRKDAWLGFNPNFRGFGGEECYIHEKYRQAGQKTLCLPFLRWWHRFPRPGGVKYPTPLWDKVRNYVLGASELGLPLEPIHQHFVTDLKKMTEDNWQNLIADPLNNVRPPNGTPMEVKADTTLDSLFADYSVRKRDLEQHAKYIKDLAASVDRVTMFTKRREWSVFVAASRPKVLIDYNVEIDIGSVIQQAINKDISPGRKIEKYTSELRDSNTVPTIDQTDLLILDTVHNADRLHAELLKYANSVTRFILIRGTGAFGEYAESKEPAPGLWAALRDFVSDKPDWFVIYSDPKQYGITVLGKQEQDKPETPIIPWPKGVGPGTELATILAEFNIHPGQGCTCKQLARDMDVWGVAECRNKMQLIVTGIKNNQKGWKWQDKLTAAFQAVRRGYTSIESMVADAINIAEKKEKESTLVKIT